MTYRGVVKNGLVRLDERISLPEGTAVSVRPLRKKSKAPRRNKSLSAPGQRLIKYAGKAKGLPADAARNLDHYLYGHPRQ